MNSLVRLLYLILKIQMAAVRIYADLRSQPVRTVVDFCKLAKIPFEVKQIDLFKGEEKKPEFLAINAMGEVPALEDLREENKGFSLGESHAIMKYIINTFEVADHFYPKEPKTRALIDQYLDGHHTKIRGIVKVLVPKVLLHLFAPPEVVKARNDPKVLEPLEKAVEKSFKELNDVYLGNPARVALAKEKGLTNWIATVDEKPSIADLRAYEEIYQLVLIPEWLEKLLEANPNVKEWFDKMGKIPEIKETQETLLGFKKYLAEKKEAAA